MARGIVRRQTGKKGQTATAQSLSVQLAAAREAYLISNGPAREERLATADVLVGQLATVSAGMHTRGRNRRGILSSFMTAEPVIIDAGIAPQQTARTPFGDPDYSEVAARYEVIAIATPEKPTTTSVNGKIALREVINA